MSSYLDHITEFLFDENRRLSSKAALVVFVVIAVIFIDNILGFSYYYNIEKKVEQVQKLNSLIKDPTTDSTTKSFAIVLRSEILERENMINHVVLFFRNMKWSQSKDIQTNKNKTTQAIINTVEKNSFWFHLSAGGLYYLLSLLMIPIMVFTDKNTSLPQRIATGILAGAVFFSLGWLFYWLCTFIPQISSVTWFWNYTINFILQLFILGLLIISGSKKK